MALDDIKTTEGQPDLPHILRKLAKWLEEYEVWYERQQENQTEDSNPGGDPPPKPPGNP